MTYSDFVYWLQGHFEITDSEPYSKLTVRRKLEIIENHVNMCMEYMSRDKNYKLDKCGKFVIRLSGALQFMDRSDENNLEVIRTDLNDVFEHVIDTTSIFPDPPVYHNPHPRQERFEDIQFKC